MGGSTVDLEGLGTGGLGDFASGGGGGGFEGDGFASDLEGAGPEAEGDGPGGDGGPASVVPCARPATPAAKLGATVPASSTTVSSAVSTTTDNPHVFPLRPTASPS
ncbi:hypothetical protein [Streptomyces sp. BPTC-684]|uniref:hypothetical protein n=1 Tax=Streptomyces sp. BPTC-684 TaxID=3043734 RepID=UPI0024B0A56A|nr:hypothetical protein [Streptomyces sp. BPTC-684]WHM40362.1 hypothetical protein QIY60_28230 [Streptomyces sp. BPTC-684]